MGLRFRKTLTLCPGLKLNFSGSGISMTAGQRGASITVGGRGSHLNLSLPGTGLSYRHRLGASASRGPSGGGNSPSQLPEVLFSISEDGALCISDLQGRALPQDLSRAVKSVLQGDIRQFLDLASEQINRPLLDIRSLHLGTPPAQGAARFTARPFELPRPCEPSLKPTGMLDKLLGQRERIEQENERLQAQFRSALADWEAERRQNMEREAERRHLFEVERLVSLDGMERFLGDALEGVSWPRQTLVALHLPDRETVFLDVDLPEIEEMPTRIASVAARGDRLTMKVISESQRRKDYAHHVHAIGFRAIGEAFAALPKLKRVIVSGFSQRIDPTTGHLQDDYLFSVQVTREPWSRINFFDLALIDPVDSLASFDNRRNMTKTGIFKAITPFSPEDLTYLSN